jgi:hypothetical protein
MQGALITVKKAFKVRRWQIKIWRAFRKFIYALSGARKVKKYWLAQFSTDRQSSVVD